MFVTVLENRERKQLCGSLGVSVSAEPLTAVFHRDKAANIQVAAKNV